MSTPRSKRVRRRLLLAGGAGLFGIASILTGRRLKAGRNQRGSKAEVKRLVSRINLPGDVGSMMEAFGRDPEKVNRFRELTRWRKLREKQLRKV